MKGHKWGSFNGPDPEVGYVISDYILLAETSFMVSLTCKGRLKNEVQLSVQEVEEMGW